MKYQIFSIIILLAFYAIYIGKMFSQKKKGIRTDQIAHGNKAKKLFIIELIMKFTTYSIVVIELGSILLNTAPLPEIVRYFGLICGFTGVGVFAIAVYTMRDSWRAGIPENDKTQMITRGIYSFCRNPAFLGFDLVYIGILLMFFNWLLFIFSIAAIILLHLQILQEEKFLPSVFGEEYLQYKNKVPRYF